MKYTFFTRVNMNEELTILLQHLLLHNTSLIILVNVNINILRTSTLLKSKVVFLTLVNALSSKLTLANN